MQPLSPQTFPWSKKRRLLRRDRDRSGTDKYTLEGRPWWEEWLEMRPMWHWLDGRHEPVKSLSRVRLFAIPWTVAYQPPPSMGFSRQGCWSGLPFPSPGDLPGSGIEPGSPALQADALPSELPGETHNNHMLHCNTVHVHTHTHTHIYTHTLNRSQSFTEQYLTLLYVTCCTLGHGMKNGFRFGEQEASNFKS